MYERSAFPDDGFGLAEERMVGRVLAVLAAAVLLLGAILTVPVGSASPMAGQSPLPDATGSINVEAVADYGYQPDTLQQVPTNANITVTFTDEDVLEHSFVIVSREGFVIPSSYTPTQLDELLVAYPPFYSVFANESQVVVGSFQSPAVPGWYEFVCTVSGHFQNGMYGFIAFGENLPSNLTNTARVGIGGVSIGVIGGAAAGAVVVAVLLGYVLWRRRHPPHRMPAESL